MASVECSAVSGEPQRPPGPAVPTPSSRPPRSAPENRKPAWRSGPSFHPGLPSVSQVAPRSGSHPSSVKQELAKDPRTCHLSRSTFLVICHQLFWKRRGFAQGERRARRRNGRVRRWLPHPRASSSLFLSHQCLLGSLEPRSKQRQPLSLYLTSGLERKREKLSKGSPVGLTNQRHQHSRPDSSAV